MSNKSDWIRDPKDRNENHWVSLKYVTPIDKGLEHWWSASVKWDGCIHFSRAYNEPFKEHGHNGSEDNSDYIHICDIDEYIEILTKLRDAAKIYFATHDREWPE